MIEDDESEGNPLSDIMKDIKTNRIILIGLVVLAVVTVTIFTTGIAVLSTKVWSSVKVPSKEFSQKLDTLDERLAELMAEQEMQASAYISFQDGLDQVKQQFNNDRVKNLKKLLAEHEEDHRLFLTVMNSGMTDLSVMSNARKESVSAFKKEMKDLMKTSEKRQEDFSHSSGGY